LAQFREAQVRREAERKASAERALRLLRDNRIWERYAAHLDEDARARQLWEQRGVPSSFQGWWQLGYDPAHRFWRDGSMFESATLTIPLFGKDWEPRNVKHRLLTPHAWDRYRYELAGLGQPEWRANPEADLSGHVYAVEGEIKAMVVFSRLDDAQVRMVGLPGATPGDEVLSSLAQADRVTLLFDPDAKAAAVRLARKLGIQRTWLLIPAVKVDDGIIAGRLEKQDVRRLLDGALRLSDWVVDKGAPARA